MSGRTIIVTGASDGIGAAAARQLHAKGENVVVVGRSPAKTNTVADELGVDRYVVDFAHLQQVRELAFALQDKHPRIDVLINNAGLIAGSERITTADGHEQTFQINHLAPYLLTTLLQDRLVRAQGRVISTSSAVNVNKQALVNLDDLDMEHGYRPLRAYSTSKLENILFIRELARRWASLGVTAASVHPGLIRSQFGHASSFVVRIAVSSPLKWLMRSADEGADTIVWLATSTPGLDWTSGGYYSNRRLGATNAQADDLDLARGLWDRSAEFLAAEPEPPTPR
jgi:NAD(P)-dependent dehydrogenase (short-subunit alcohol dehydrogenase family)